MTLGFIGCGNMGEAILAGNYKKRRCMVCEAQGERQIYLKKKYRVSFGTLPEVVSACEMVILAVKPQDFSCVLEEIAARRYQGKLFVSIAAGVRTDSLEKVLGPVRVVRVMPNLPALLGAGVSALCRGRKATLKDLAEVQAVFAGVGSSLVVKEDAMNAVTAVSGSGPAYVFLFAECMMNAAREIGLSEKEARMLVGETLLGASRMLTGSKDSAADLRRKVTSKGGTTQAAMDVFMSRNISALIGSAIKAARDRASELSL